MKAAVLSQYRKIEIQNREIPKISDDEVLVKVIYASICGSDQHIFKGEFHPRTKLPLVPGHEFAGIIEKTGKHVAGLKTGQPVTVDPIIPCGNCPACKRKHYPACSSLKLVGIDLDGGFAQYIAINKDMIFPVPGNVSLENAALVEVLSIGFHAISRAGLGKKDSIAVWGAGKVGQSILHAAKTMTAGKIFMVDIIEERLKIVQKAFPDVHIINSLNTDPQGYILNHTSGEGVDIAFEAVGHFKEVNERLNPVMACVKAIRGGGIVCVLGLSDLPTELNMKELIWKEAKIITSRVSHGEFSKSIEALSNGRLNPESMITSIFEIEKTQEAFLALEENPEKHLKILLKISG